MIEIGFQKTFKALADPMWRDILILLKKDKMSAGEIASNFNVSGATVLYHFSMLKDADLIFKTKQKNFVCYELNISVFEETRQLFLPFKGGKDV